MAEVVCKGVKGLAAGFTGETRRVGLVYDFAQDGGAFSGKVYTLANISSKILVTRVIVRSLKTVTSAGAATVIVGHTDDDNYFVDATGGAKANLAADAVAAAATTSVPLVLAADKQITLTIGTADLTDGKILVEVWYKDVNAG